MQFIGTGDRILTENFNVGYLYTITFKTGIYINSACIGIGDTFVMFQKAEPDLLFTLNMDTADEVDTIELYDSGGGTNDYEDLSNKPQINSITLSGNKSSSDLGLQPTISDLNTIRAGAAAGATAVQPADMTSALAAKQDALSTAQLAAVNSGITSTDVAQITTNKNNILFTATIGECGSTSNTANKVVTVSDVNYTPHKGSIIAVKFKYGNNVADTAEHPITLNVNNTGAYRIWYKNGDYANASQGKVFGLSGYYIYYMYDGVDRWVWINYCMDNTYSLMSQAEASAGTATNERLINAKVLSDTIDEKLVPVENNISSLTERFIGCQFIASRADYAEHTFTVNRSNTTGRYHYGIFMVGTPSTYGIYKIFYNDASTPASATVERVLGNSTLTYTATIAWNGLVGTLTLTGSDKAYGGIRGIWFD